LCQYCRDAIERAFGRADGLPALTAGQESVAPARSLRDWILLTRPTHWVKNLFVLGPLYFSGRAFELDAVIEAALAFTAFCLASSGVYLVNDVADRVADRVHPIKRLRPVAAGRVSVRDATVAGLGLSAMGLILAAVVSLDVMLLIGAYLALNAAYTWRLKRVVVLDVFVLASFFLLRLLTGAAAVHVRPSIWLLLVGGLLALYLGFTKRRHELVLLGDQSPGHRNVLSSYTAPFLDQISTVLLAVTVVGYVMYTLESGTAAAVPGERLAYSTVFVLYGVFRYLFLVHRQDEGGSPTQTLLSDRQLLLIVAAWAFYCGLVIYQAR
jgi:4-hydroxybenzoate polyprenyltransferase